MLLHQEKVFHQIAGFDDYPHQSTFSRHLEKFTVPVAKKIGGVNVGLMMKVRKNLRDYEQISLDFNSHVKTVYGKLQRSRKGYNPEKPSSFHPL